MIFPDLVQLYQFQYLFRLFYFFLPLPRLLFILIVAFMPKLLVIYMNMMSVGSLPGCDEASKIFQGILGTIIGCRRQLSIYLAIMLYFIIFLPFWAAIFWLCLWPLYGSGLFWPGCCQWADIFAGICWNIGTLARFSVMVSFFLPDSICWLFGRAVTMGDILFGRLFASAVRITWFCQWILGLFLIAIRVCWWRALKKTWYLAFLTWKNHWIWKKWLYYIMFFRIILGCSRIFHVCFSSNFMLFHGF